MRLHHSIALTTVAACLVPWAFPPTNLSPLMVVALALHFAALRGASARQSFYQTGLFGAIAYGATLRWLPAIFGTGAAPLIALLAFYLAIVGWLTVRWRRDASWPALVTAAAIWTVVEWLRSEVLPLRFAWITPGTAFGPTALSPWIGVYGTTWLAVIVALAAIHAARRRAAVAGFAALLVLWLWSPAHDGAGDGPPIDVALVQDESCDLATLLAATRPLADDPPDLIVWPEYALPYDLATTRHVRPVLRALCADLDAVLVLGSKRALADDPNQWENIALVVNADGIVDAAAKVRPVPFFDDGVPGPSPRPIDTRFGALGAPTCFDNDFMLPPRIIAAHGAAFFVAPTFDAEHWTPLQHEQHAVLFQCRAAETRRWYAVAASSGVTQCIDPAGRVRARSAGLAPEVIRSTIHARRDVTFHTRIGWWLVPSGAVLAILGAVVRRREPDQ